MEKMLLVDGNSMLFRAYYATIYSRPMTTSKGIHTNAVFGFYRMLDKAIRQINPKAVLVAFDTGRVSFRNEIYPEYKGTRKEVPEELKVQFPIVRQLLDAMHMPRYEQEGVEADDIIGSMVKKYPDWDINILSSDRDLLQLIDETTSVWLMKKGITEIAEMDEKTFYAEYELKPDQIIDIKALMGDASDNIPGVPGIGEKTAVKLLKEYGSLENLYQHTEDLKGKQKENIENNKDTAFLSQTLATIKCDVDIPLTISEICYKAGYEDLYKFFKQYEMNSLLKEIEGEIATEDSVDRKFHKVSNISAEILDSDPALYFDSDNYSFSGKLHGIAFYDGKNCEYITIADVMESEQLLDWLQDGGKCCTYEIKGGLHLLKHLGISWHKQCDDVLLMTFLVDTSISDWNKLSEKYHTSTIDESKRVYGKVIDEQLQLQHACLRAHDIWSVSQKVNVELSELNLMKLYQNLELPLSEVLYEMEEAGIVVDSTVLDKIAVETQGKMDEVSEIIYSYTKEPFNLNSPKQLAEILFDELSLPQIKKRSTAVDVLEKLIPHHPIVALIMEYRKYQKLYSTYAEGLKKFIYADGRIHTNYRQNVTQTGRLSSIDPNLQNITVRDEASREIRKAFVASATNYLVSSDYSQIELRVLAHMANEERLLNAFNNNLDIHTQTAMDIFHVSADEVDSNMRRQAKAVNFGIVYGISDYGLAEQIGVSRKQAQEYIENYFASYPNIEKYMAQQVEFCQENGYVETLLGRRRDIPEIHDNNYMIREFGKRAAMNAPIQGTAADLIKIAMLNIQKRIAREKLASKMILQVHDELVFDVVQEELPTMMNLIEEEMTQAMDLDVPLVVEVNYGVNWYEAK